MNLCGGLVNMTEPEHLLLEIPDEKFQMTPRRKSSSSAPSRRRKGPPTSLDTGRRTPTGSRHSSSSRPSSTRSKSRHSPSISHSPVSGQSPTFLNPISRDDLKKSRSRQRPHGPPRHSQKLSSGPIKKLEAGFHVALLSAASGTRRTVLLDVNSDKTCLRVRHRDENGSDNENDRSKSNYSDARLKIMDITRLEIGREKTSKKSGSSSKPKSFTIVMRKAINDDTVFNFEAGSSVERDSIIGAIKAVLEYSKSSSESRRRRVAQSAAQDESLRGGRSTTSRGDGSHGKGKGETSAAPRTSSEEAASSTAAYFDFDVPHDGEQLGIEAEARSDSAERSSDDDQVRSGGSGSSCSHEAETAVVERSVMEEATLDVAEGWGMSGLLCGAQPAMSRRDRNTSGAKDNRRTSRAEETDTALQKIDESFLSNALGGCNSQALAAVEDVELAAMAANQVSAGPWCTDDVCTNSLKDFTDTMKGIFEMKQQSREGKGEEEKQRAMAEDYITGVLGAPTTVANLLSVQDMWQTADKPTTLKKKRFENRSRNAGAQAARLNRLRKQMTFTAAHASEKMPYVQIVSSYDDIDRAGRFGKKVKAAEVARGDRKDSSTFLKNVVDNMNPVETSSDSDVDLLYYDSDPEDVRELALKRGPRRAMAEKRNLSPRARPARKEALSDIPMARLGLNRRLKRLDEDIIAEIIDTMKSEQMTLIWHPTETDDNKNRTPVCSKAWIESGIYLIDGTFLLPKLTWVPHFEGSLQQKVLNVSVSNPGAIDLLDVSRVRECDKVDRKRHPFAKAECSFIVQTQKEMYLFEAQSKAERGRIVSGFRLVIARLASLLMLRDLRAVDEFFGGNSSVPGEAPIWAQGKSEKKGEGSPGFP